MDAKTCCALQHYYFFFFFYKFSKCFLKFFVHISIIVHYLIWYLTRNSVKFLNAIIHIIVQSMTINSEIILKFFSLNFYWNLWFCYMEVWVYLFKSGNHQFIKEAKLRVHNSLLVIRQQFTNFASRNSIDLQLTIWLLVSATPRKSSAESELFRNNLMGE